MTFEIDKSCFKIVYPGGVFLLTVGEAETLKRFLNDNHEKLRPNKNWEACPYESHSDCCNCNGSGGDR